MSTAALNPETSTDQVQIEEITVTGLFGMFDHTIRLNTDERITILHGPNGYGKTAILTLINDLFNGHPYYRELRDLPFATLRVYFADSRELLVVKEVHASNDKDDNDQVVKLQITGRGHQEEHTLPPLKRLINVSSGVMHALGLTSPVEDPYLRTVRYLLGRTPNWEDPWEKNSLSPLWFESLRGSLRVRLVQTQRLLKYPGYSRDLDSQTPTQVAAQYAKDLAQKLEATLAEYAALSQALDRSFPARLVERAGGKALTVDQLRAQLDRLEAKREALAAVGLLNGEAQDFLVPQEIDERTKDVLAIYVEDAAKKLAVFDELTAKIELLTTTINKRFQYKQMRIGQDVGFEFVAADGKVLSSTRLSSGEQHELVLLYELLFHVQPGSLILIDEPELSLHIAWQMEFLKDLQAIIKLADFDVLIATHSPQIINDRWDLTVELQGPAL